MQNQKNYQKFQEEQEFTGGIPVGQPVEIQMQNVHQPQQPYFQQQAQNPFQHPNQFHGIMPQPIYPFNQPPQGLMPMPLYASSHLRNNQKVYNNSVIIRCPCCKNDVPTIVNLEAGNVTHGWAFAICCFLGQCCCLPYLFDDCLDRTHYCPNCGQAVLRKHAKCLDIIN